MRASLLVLSVLILPMLQAQTVVRTKVPILIQEMTISGTSSLDSVQIDQIRRVFLESKFNDDSEEIKDRLRAAFSEEGYFDATVHNVRIRALDPLGNPKPVRIEAEMSEGPRYRFSEFRFTGNRAFSEKDLRDGFSIRIGDFFNHTKIQVGLTGIRSLYLSRGYLDMFAIPAVTQSADATLAVDIDVSEGDQYKMGKFDILGDGYIAQWLFRQWTLDPGQPFDAKYVSEFFNYNLNVMPIDATFKKIVYVTRNCRDHSVDVLFDFETKHDPGWVPPKDVGCDRPKPTEDGSAKFRFLR